MPSKKRTPGPTLQTIVDEMRSHSVILEDMRSQNQATIEAVFASRQALEERSERLERRLEGLERETRSRDASLELAIRDLKVSVQQNTVDIRDLHASVHQNTLDVRELAGKVIALTRLEERVSALEQRSA
jgi:hypothetical protein